MKELSTPSGRPKARCAEGSTEGRETGRGDRLGWSWLVTGVSLFPGARPGRALSQLDWPSTLPAPRFHDDGLRRSALFTRAAFTSRMTLTRLGTPSTDPTT